VSQADWDRLQYYSRKVKFFILLAIDTDIDGPQVHPSTYIRIAQLQSSALFPSLRHLHYHLDDRSISHIFLFLSPLLDSLTLSNIGGFENTIVGPFLANLSSPMLSRIILRTGRMSVDIFKKSIVRFKQLRSICLSDAVFMSDFALWEVLGTLPALADLTLKANDPASHPVHATENSNSRSRGPKYFVALESLCVTGSFFFIQHLLGFIDSQYLESIKVHPVINRVRKEHVHDSEDEDHFTSFITVVASKWSQSLKNLVTTIRSSRKMHRTAVSKCLMLFTDFHEMQKFDLMGWKMEITDDDVRRLVMSWPKLRTLNLHHTFISLSTLRIIAENCPELRHLLIQLDTSTIPPFDTSSKSLHHNLEILTVGGHKVHSSNTITAQTTVTLKCQIQVTQYLDLIFPCLKGIDMWPDDVFWLGVSDLVELCQKARRVK
jgi:hypothetical protein